MSQIQSLLRKVLKKTCVKRRNLHYSQTTCSSYDGTRVQDVLDKWSKSFDQCNVSEPMVSAEYIVAHILGQKKIHDVNKRLCLSIQQISEIEKLSRLRLKGMPVQYILGNWDFQDMIVKMRQPVLIPRPETEELADLCSSTLQHLSSESQQPSNSLKFLEVGCGTGALSICLLKRFPQAAAVAVDVSCQAYDLTVENAKALGVENRLAVLEGDINNVQDVEEMRARGPYQLVVSNPPYVSTAEMEHLQTEIKHFEDPRALHGGLDGLDVIRAILKQAPSLLHKDGHVWLEVGKDHPSKIRQMMSGHPLTYLETVKDFSESDRFCHLKWASKS